CFWNSFLPPLVTVTSRVVHGSSRCLRVWTSQIRPNSRTPVGRGSFAGTANGRRLGRPFAKAAGLRAGRRGTDGHLDALVPDDLVDVDRRAPAANVLGDVVAHL